MMLPVASPSRDGYLPYSGGHLDRESNTVYLTTAPDWPGNSLPPTLSEARLRFRYPIPTLHPEEMTEISWLALEDQAGNWIHRNDPTPIKAAVEPSSPLRLFESQVVYGPTGARDEYGPRATEVERVQGKRLCCTVPVTGRGALIPEGRYAITATVPGICKFSIQVTPTESRKDEYTAAVAFQDNRGPLADFSHQAGWIGYAGLSLSIIGPNGAPVLAKPVLVPGNWRHINRDPYRGRGGLARAARVINPVGLRLLGQAMHEDGNSCYGGCLSFHDIGPKGDGDEALLKGLFHFGCIEPTLRTNEDRGFRRPG